MESPTLDFQCARLLTVESAAAPAGTGSPRTRSGIACRRASITTAQSDLIESGLMAVPARVRRNRQCDKTCRGITQLPTSAVRGPLPPPRRCAGVLRRFARGKDILPAFVGRGARPCSRIVLDHRMGSPTSEPAARNEPSTPSRRCARVPPQGNCVSGKPVGPPPIAFANTPRPPTSAPKPSALANQPPEPTTADSAAGERDSQSGSALL
jgi:hypothetical protein